MRAWLLYTIARVGIFVALFLVLFLLLGPTWWWVAAIAAALMGAAISFLALNRLRADAAAQLAARREGRASTADLDAAAEDAEAE